MKISLPSRRKMAAAFSITVLSALIVIGWSVDDAAHTIWEGGNTQKKLTDGQWQVLEAHTYQLQAAATLISLGGTGKSDAYWTASPGFQANVMKLRDTAVAARHAVEAKNHDALSKVGDDLVTVCEGGHKQFKPTAPTEGIYDKPYYDECTNTFVPE